MKKIAIIGSRKLACEITKWIVKTQDVIIVGAIHPPFDGWWEDGFKAVLIDNSIPIFNDFEQLLKVTPDIIFSINYWKKIDYEDIKLIPGGIINVHHSYLLKYKGRYSTSWAIINARKLNCWEHGTTLHYINHELDEGDIISSYKCEITENETAETLFEKVENLAVEMFKRNFNKIIDNSKIEYLQADKESFFYDRNSNNLEIPYGMPLEEVYDFLRAWTFKDRPKPYILFNNKKIILTLSDNN
jgi:methionyl-tRNA formyltransferase